MHDTSTAIAVVTSQLGQTFKPLTEGMQKVLNIRKDKLFENSATRLFYQDRISRKPNETNAYSVSVSSKTGTCSCHLAALPTVSEEITKKIALSLGPAE